MEGMRRAMSEETGIQPQRGFWLRCFLGWTWPLLLLTGSLRAQVDIPKALHLTHVGGVVVNSRGRPVVNVEVTLVRDDTVAFRTRTDGNGAFDFDRASGRYWFRVARSEYAPAATEVSVQSELVTYLERKKLYVIVGPGACMDECSSVFTKKHDFDQAIRKKNRN
jgi:hypothetical protein